jgi:WhiB family redox-sensing transcriptional regulator
MSGTETTWLEQHWAWADRGACTALPDLFYNAEDEPKGVRRRKEAAAKKLCAGCPVLAECRAHAMANRELYGVWGGLTESERHRLAGRQRTG